MPICIAFELVQTKGRELCPPRTPLALSIWNSHIWCHTDRHKQWKMVPSPLVCSGPLLIGLALAAITCPHRPQSFKKVDNTADSRYPKARLQHTSRKYSKIWLRSGANIKPYFGPKVDPILKLGQTSSVFCTKVRVSTPFRSDKTLKNSHTFYMCLPRPDLPGGRGIFFFWSPE